MKLKKAKILLDKINNLFSNIADNPGKVAAMERDLLLNYLRDLYDIIIAEDKEEVKDTASLKYKALLKEKEDALRKLDLARIEAEKKAEEERTLREKAELNAFKEQERKKALEEAASAAAKQKEEEEELKKKAAEAAAREALVSKNDPIPQSKVVAAREPEFSEDMEDLFERQETKELSQKISLRPVKNIKRAISINDRLLYINELYNKDASSFEQTINTLDSLENFDQARLYLEEKVVNQFNWLAKKRKKRAIEFIDVARRRFL